MCHHAAKYYEQPNGLFRWHKDVLKPLEMLILNSPINALLSHLKNMAKNYRQLKDGYPDLMIVDNSAEPADEGSLPRRSYQSVVGRRNRSTYSGRHGKWQVDIADQQEQSLGYLYSGVRE